MIRSTTNGTLNTYRYQLQRSTYNLNSARNTVQTGRQFNSFAEDPAAAAKSFQLRRSYLRAQSQYSAGQSVCSKYDVAWSTLETVVNDVDNAANDSAYKAIINAENDTNGSARIALGENLCQRAESLIQSMNGRYGDNFVFSGADGLTIPFTWEADEDGSKTLCYRGISVDTTVPDLVMDGGKPVAYESDTPVKTTDPADAKYYKTKDGDFITIEDYKKLSQDDAPGLETDDTTGDPFMYAKPPVTTDPDKAKYYETSDGEFIEIEKYEQLEKDMAALTYMSKDETKYVDVGLGLEKDSNGNILDSSAVNVALQGINFLGYGVDEDGDPKNIASIMNRMGEILKNCDADDGSFAEGEREEFYRLAEKFEDAASLLSDKHVELDAQADFLNTNQTQLEKLSDTLNEQIVAVEDVDAAEAITALSWAQYCYNAALQCGTSILSQSLMDYLNR